MTRRGAAARDARSYWWNFSSTSAKMVRMTFAEAASCLMNSRSAAWSQQKTWDSPSDRHVALASGGAAAAAVASFW